MARQRSPNKETTPGNKSYTYIAHSAARRVRPGFKPAKDKKPHYHQNPRQSPLYRKTAPRLTFEADTTLFEPTAAGYSDNKSNQKEEESSEGEDWDDGATLVHAFMDLDQTEPRNMGNAKINLVEGLNVPFGQVNTATREELKQVLIATLDQIRDKHHDITAPKGPDRRIRDGVQRFLNHTLEYTQELARTQEEYEQAHVKCQATTVDLFNQLQQVYQKKHQSCIDYNNLFKEKFQKTRAHLVAAEEEFDALEALFNKRLKTVARFDTEKNLQSILSLLT